MADTSIPEHSVENSAQVSLYYLKFVAFFVVLNVSMLGVLILSIFKPDVFILSDLMLSVFLLSVLMLSV